jgi:tRNA dimethylallyltransferase
MDAKYTDADNHARPVLCIVGPTASGKSALAVDIAKALGSEVLSADSMQVYRGMDVGTAKLTQKEMQGVPHHLMDLVNPDDLFTVAHWVKQADTVIDQLHRAGKLPIIAGGTGLYVRAITEDLHFGDQTGSSEIRDNWQSFAQEHGKAALHDALRERDESSADRLHPNDIRRVIRALEVHELSDEPLSSRYEWAARGGRYHTVQLGLTLERGALYARANARVDLMMASGLYNEVEGLLAQGYNRDLTSMQAIGYKEIAQAVTGDVPLDKAIEQVKQATRRFVKRQMSWFRRDERIQWLHVDPKLGVEQDDFDNVFTIASNLLAGIRVQ